MVNLSPPPPQSAPRPILYQAPAGTAFVRLFNPTDYGTRALTFRAYGPLRRFDHHRGQAPDGAPGDDPQRSVYYAAPTLSSCIVEVFGDTGVISCGDWHIAWPHTIRPLSLLDLRGHCAMRAGTLAAIAKESSRALTQQWSRFFYERTDLYSTIDGLIFFNAHNDEEAIGLYERAKDAFVLLGTDTIRLDDLRIRPTLIEIANRNNLVLDSDCFS